MKKLLTLITILLAGVLSAGEYEDLLKKAESTSYLSERLELWQKALPLAPSEAVRLNLNQEGLELALRLKKTDFVKVFALNITKSPLAAGQQKTAAMFEYLNSMPKYTWNARGVPSPQWEEYLAMPDKKPEHELTALHQLTNAYHAEDEWFREIEVMKKILEHPRCAEYEKVNTLLNLSKLYQSMNRMDDALDCVKQTLKLNMSKKRRAESYILLGDIMQKGFGYYYKPSEKQYKEMQGYYLKAIEANPKDYSIASATIVKLVSAAYKYNRHKEVLELTARYINRKGMDAINWKKIKDMQGNTYQRLEQHKEAIEVFEELYKFQHNLPDTCMSLGYNYYCNGNYTMALGMYDEALVELGRADDARPAQCKRWIRTLKWFTGGGQKQLENLRTAYVKRLNAEAVATGKNKVAERNKPSSLRPFGEKPKVKKKPTTLEEINKVEERDILEEGLF